MPMLERDDSIVLLVDFQEKLRKAIDSADASIARAAILAKAARKLDVPVIASEQNPKGLGSTVADLEELVDFVFPKGRFSAAGEEVLQNAVAARGTVLICGWETHVCVTQTALQLKEAGKRVVIVEDAVSSRSIESKQTALRRFAHHGIEVVNVEMALFEWLGTHEDAAFREVIALVK